jgi:hypothetical protein
MSTSSPLGSILAQTVSLEVSTTKILTDEKLHRTRHFQQVDEAPESAALELRVGEPLQRSEHLCRERDNKCLIVDLYSVLELRDVPARKQNFVGDAFCGPREARLQEILGAKEFRLVRIVAPCQISNILTIGTLVGR